ncbi:MAG TPA: NAD(P)-dependent alcohol dehydrogenase [Gemmatimonadales bacterium]|nr:NAD(P)-dependent alcohol dehydrogenase [Gemmatimonadales bacterium]
MMAIVYHQYGSADAVEYAEVEKPAVGKNQVLVKVHAASLNALDWHLLSADIFLVRLMGGLRKPKDPRLGYDLAGRVEAVGSEVTRFHPGDEVFGAGAGAFAEYAAADEPNLALKPVTLPFETAAAVPVAALTALQGLRDHGRIQPGQRVLIQGASGGVGTFAVQIAKAFGAEVTAVCSTRNVDLVRSIGADHVIDYTGEDFTRKGQQYDLILAVNGYHPLAAYRRALSRRGRLVLVGASADRLTRAMFQAVTLGPLISMIGGQKMVFLGKADIKQQDLLFVAELIGAGKVVPVIDRFYRLSETAEAFRYYAEVHPRGKVVIQVWQN